ncbi:MAG: molybdenum cofactor guanylyltransferase [Planctomycetota bacterium]
MRCVAGVLVGGLSTRMGRPKATLPHPNGRTLLEHVISVARQPDLWIDEIVLLGRCADPPASLADMRTLADPLPNAGPLAGLCALLEYAVDRWALLLACDMPRLQPSLLERLRVAAGPEHDAVVFRRPDRPGGYHTCCALYHPRLLPAALHELRHGSGSLQRPLAAARVAALDPLPVEEEMLTNLNTPAEYERLWT